MFEIEELIKHPDYWMEGIQNEIYYTLRQYQKKHRLNQTQLAEKLGFSKGYISQILQGKFNHSIKKLIELGLAIDKILNIQFIDIENYLRLYKGDNTKVVQLTSNTSTKISVQKQPEQISA